MLPNPSAIDDAIVALLLGDAQLKTLMPDGVWFGVAGTALKRFVLVSLVTADDTAQFGAVQKRRAFEDRVYLVKSVELKSAGNNSWAAAARIDAILEDVTLTVTGYGPLSATRVQPERMLEKDEAEPTIRWEHAGGQYRVFAGLTN